MDPFSATGVASAIISSVEFSWGLVVGAREIYKSADGTTDEHAHIGKVISDLQDVTYDIEYYKLGNYKHEKSLRRLAFECAALSGELLNILKDLKQTGGIRDGVHLGSSGPVCARMRLNPSERS